ncbi:MAG: hypothetical protein QOJ59_1065 [Thermomicrobiales bacterium]|nr:hypothetical protein [Thermomicrobiales bacterium]
MREYRLAAAYHREAARLAPEGWWVEPVDDRQTLRVRPAPCLRVTYKRLR